MQYSQLLVLFINNKKDFLKDLDLLNVIKVVVFAVQSD